MFRSAGSAHPMRSRRPWCFSHPTTAATSRERNCLWMAASHKCRPCMRNFAETQFLKGDHTMKKEVSPMEDKKIYLLAELTILPGFLQEVKTILKEALIPTLQEPGCEALYETGRKDDPHKLVRRQG